MSEINAAVVDRLIAENVDTYKATHRRIIADYGNERKLTADYNGRQLLELLQNADDAGTDRVEISLDEERCILRIANNGEPFSAEGLGSLMIAGTSTKNKREYIGNKGLGFRAVLSWVENIKIITRDCILEFSHEIATCAFECLVPDAAERAALIERQDDLPAGTSPFAVLAIPKYEQKTDLQDWETIIELHYHPDVLSDIKEQLADITPEVLLFLNHTQHIAITCNGQLQKSLRRTVLKAGEIVSRVQVNDKIWSIWDSGELSFPGEDKQFYRYKVAWQDDLSDKDAVFYTFFPTRVESHLPCLIHGTFELTSDRNHLVKHKHNAFVLEKIAETLSTISFEYLRKKGKPDWKAYLLLYPKSLINDKWLSAFYDKLKECRLSLSVYPSVDSDYYKRTEVAYYSDAFSEWVMRRKLAPFFKVLLQAIPPDCDELKKATWPYYKTPSLVQAVERASPQIRQLKVRCELIRFLASEKFTQNHKPKYPLVLSAESDQSVPADVTVFLTRQGSVSLYRIPKYVKLRFISPDFYQALLAEFQTELKQLRIANEDRSRPLKRLLGNILNLGSNDITDVIGSISKTFNKKLDKKREAGAKPETIEQLFREYIACLYRIFELNPDRRGVINETVYLRNRQGDARRSDDLFLGKEFPSGTFTEELFEGVYTEADYVAGNDFWQLGNGSAKGHHLDEFFVWLGVNRLTKTKKEAKSFERHGTDEYINFVFSRVGKPNFEPHKEYEVKVVQGLEKMFQAKSFTRERYIAWIIKDPGLRKLLQDDANDEKFIYTYNGIRHTIYAKPSYFKFQLDKAELFKNVFADSSVAKQLNLVPFNLKDEIFRKWNVSETAILETLRQLGAIVSFASLSPDNIFRLLNSAGEQSGSPRNLYQMALAYFKFRDGEDFSAQIEKLKLWAMKGTERRFLPAGSVYYTDNVTLPERITSEMWVLDFPRKRGEQQVSKYFGVRRFKSLTISLTGTPVLHPVSNAFLKWVETIKPYLLMYRLHNQREDSAARRDFPSLEGDATSGIELANLLKQVKIILVSSATYVIDQGKQKSLLPGEFIPVSPKDYYLCAPDFLSLAELNQAPDFCEAFAEIICMVYDTQKSKDDFKAVFKDSPDLRATKYAVDVHSLAATLTDAEKLLGISEIEWAFWKAVLSIKGVVLESSLTSREALEQLLRSKLGYCPSNDVLVDFDKWEESASYELLRELNEKTGIELEQIRLAYPCFPGLERWHYKKFQTQVFDLEKAWTFTLWKRLSKLGLSKQQTFQPCRLAYNEMADSVSLQLAKKFSFQLNVDYQQEFTKGLSDKAGFLICNGSGTDLVVRNHYPDLLEKANVLQDEFLPEIQSLLFFEGHKERIENAIREVLAHRQATDAAPPSPSAKSLTESDEKVTVHEGPLSIGHLSQVPEKEGASSRKPATYNGHGDTLKRNAGVIAERLVRDHLKTTYPDGKIHWMSRFSDDATLAKDDTLGYDIRYKRHQDDKDDDWFFVEVKSVSGNSFFISRNEVRIALANKDRYQLAIVKENKIYLDKEFFQNEQVVITFQSLLANSGIQPTDFEVSFVS